MKTSLPPLCLTSCLLPLPVIAATIEVAPHEEYDFDGVGRVVKSVSDGGITVEPPLREAPINSVTVLNWRSRPVGPIDLRSKSRRGSNVDFQAFLRGDGNHDIPAWPDGIRPPATTRKIPDMAFRSLLLRLLLLVSLAPVIGPAVCAAIPLSDATQFIGGPTVTAAPSVQFDWVAQNAGASVQFYRHVLATTGTAGGSGGLRDHCARHRRHRPLGNAPLYPPRDHLAVNEQGASQQARVEEPLKP